MTATHGGPTSLHWWMADRTHDGDGRAPWVLGQFPNGAIWVFVAATVLRWTPWDAIDTELRYVGRGALIVWGLDELTRGHSPLRRLLGALVLGWQLVALLTT
ncbi:hypothetical protein [Solicola sp. PLA-1-18]|uniref:hypothetical protein n=1 Tax=Solicola sp. PLA-1-18 TaxID=3380532 RepID=UPI003B7F4661